MPATGRVVAPSVAVAITYLEASGLVFILPAACATDVTVPVL